jgi:hypothetical protein
MFPPPKIVVLTMACILQVTGPFNGFYEVVALNAPVNKK